MAFRGRSHNLEDVMSRAPLLLLASGSPRRRELLELLLGSIDIEAADIDETPLAGEQAHDLVRRLAEEKCSVVARRHTGRTIIAADTVVVLDGDILGKPVDRHDAATMLRRLAGRRHQVISGIAVTHQTKRASVTETTEVVFRSLSDAEIDWYLGTGEADDKAGAYGIQGRAALFVERVEGSYHNVVGLSVASVDALMQSMGLDLLDFEQSVAAGRAR